MSNLKELHTTEEFDQVWEKSAQGPILVFKHSTTCPISSNAFGAYQSYANSNDAEMYFLKVRESRDVSNHIAEITGVQHQSPQIFLLHNKAAVWNTSHSKITVDSIKQAIKSENK